MLAHWESLASLGACPMEHTPSQINLAFWRTTDSASRLPMPHRTCRPLWGQGWATDSLGSGGSFLLDMYKPPTAYT